jgi:hypothetical protein
VEGLGAFEATPLTEKFVTVGCGLAFVEVEEELVVVSFFAQAYVANKIKTKTAILNKAFIL